MAHGRLDGMVKKVIARKRPAMTIGNGTSHFRSELSLTVEKLEQDLESIKEDIAEFILLDEAPVAVSVYEMSYEEQSMLPTYARL